MTSPSMTNRETLRSLAERVEALSGPNREIGREVLLACGWTKGIVGHFMGPMYHWRSPDGKINFSDDDFRLHDPTASIDSAMSLVPEGWTFTLRPKFCELRHPTLRRCDASSFAGNPAAALTAASLRAIGEGL